MTSVACHKLCLGCVCVCVSVSVCLSLCLCRCRCRCVCIVRVKSRTIDEWGMYISGVRSESWFFLRCFEEAFFSYAPAHSETFCIPAFLCPIHFEMIKEFGTKSYV